MIDKNDVFEKPYVPPDALIPGYNKMNPDQRLAAWKQVYGEKTRDSLGDTTQPADEKRTSPNLDAINNLEADFYDRLWAEKIFPVMPNVLQQLKKQLELDESNQVGRRPYTEAEAYELLASIAGVSVDVFLGSQTKDKPHNSLEKQYDLWPSLEDLSQAFDHLECYGDKNDPGNWCLVIQKPERPHELRRMLRLFQETPQEQINEIDDIFETPGQRNINGDGDLAEV